MREHMGLFRGKRTDGKGWIEGSLWMYLGKPSILGNANPVGYTVDPDTIGECTGLTDKNGKMIFEGDRVVYPDSSSPSGYDDYNEGVVDYDEEAMRFYFTDRWFVEMEDFEVIGGMMVDVEIIGTVHDKEVCHEAN